MRGCSKFFVKKERKEDLEQAIKAEDYQYCSLLICPG